MHLFNFAYGSNMLSTRIRQRVPSAQFHAVAELPGYGLRWHKRGRDGSGKCNIVAAPAERVCGVVYRLDAGHRALLDAAEGVGRGYEVREFTLALPAGPLPVFAYEATEVDELLLPFGWYRALVLAGAREHGLAPDHVAALERVGYVDDPDRQRHALHMALIDGG